MESFLLLAGDPALRERLSHYFGAQGFSLHTASDCRAAVRILEQHAVDVLLFDVPTIDLTLEDLLGAVRDSNATAVVIAMYEEPGIDEAIRAIREGASDFIRKPVNLAELEIRVSRGIELKRLSSEGQVLRGERNLIHRTASFVGRSAAIAKTLALVDKVANSSSSVLLLGETGTGKELIAGAIHYGSPRAGKAFVRVNCATLPDTLLESELFGHEKGAFTGAEKLRIGRFELGNGGSLFLDEIADVSTATQAKLLRVLQEKEFERLGSNRTIRVDVRIIAATNKDLAAAMEAGRFREDLYYRLNVVTIAIPPLRERDDDIELLAHFFLRRYARSLGKTITGIDPAAVRILKGYRWPGNIRELENTIERAVLMAETDRLTPDDLSLPFKPAAGAGGEVVRIPTGGLQWRELEKDLILQALSMSGWVQKDAARLLGLTTRVMNYKVKQFGISHPDWKNPAPDAGTP